MTKVTSKLQVTIPKAIADRYGIEDVVLVTKDGAELLSRNIPRTVEEIEAAMAD